MQDLKTYQSFNEGFPEPSIFPRENFALQVPAKIKVFLNLVTKSRCIFV